MELFHAHVFYSVGELLGRAEGASGMPLMASSKVNEDSRGHLLNHFREIRSECKSIGLTVSALHFDEVIPIFETSGATYSEASKYSSALSDTIRREMQAMKFFKLEKETQIWFDAVDLFGGETSASFPSASYDIREAGSCLALGRCTASVFHAMRVLEHGLRALAAKFKVPFENKSWNDVIEPIEKRIRDLKNSSANKPAIKKPKNWKRDEQFYSEAASQFMHFKNAWRNYTAHVQFKYTEEEAEAILRHVRDFTKHISKKLKERRR